MRATAEPRRWRLAEAARTCVRGGSGAVGHQARWDLVVHLERLRAAARSRPGGTSAPAARTQQARCLDPVVEEPARQGHLGSTQRRGRPGSPRPRGSRRRSATPLGRPSTSRRSRESSDSSSPRSTKSAGSTLREWLAAWASTIGAGRVEQARWWPAPRPPGPGGPAGRPATPWPGRSGGAAGRSDRPARRAA